MTRMRASERTQELAAALGIDWGTIIAQLVAAWIKRCEERRKNKMPNGRQIRRMAQDTEIFKVGVQNALARAEDPVLQAADPDEVVKAAQKLKARDWDSLLLSLGYS